MLRCHAELKDKILKKKTTLKGKTNVKGKAYFVMQQMPDQWNEEKRERAEQIRKAVVDAKEEGLEADIKVKNRVVYVNKNPIKKYLAVPRPRDLFVDKQKQDKIDKIKQYHSDTVTEKDPHFRHLL